MATLVHYGAARCHPAYLILIFGRINKTILGARGGAGCHKVWQRGDAVARHNIFARPKVVNVEMRKGFFSLSARASLLGWIAKVPL